MWKRTLVWASLLVVLLFSSRSLSVPAAAATEESESKDAAVNVEKEAEEGSASQKDYQRHHGNVNQLDDDEPVRYDGAQVWRLAFTDSREKNAISDLQHNFEDITMWGLNHTSVDLLVKKPIIAGARHLLSNANVTYEVVIDDLQEAIAHENPPKEVIEQFQNRKGHRMTWNAYHRAEDIDGYLEYLAKTYPEICSVKTIGFSVQNRPLKVLRISNGNAGNKAIWMDGGIHAREWISPATVTYLINEFVESYDDQPAHIQNVDWYILPLSNPDGYEYTHSTDRLWRKNRGGVGVGRCAGVDLNRNFGFHWGGQGASKRPCAETFGGTGPFSEPETMALRDFMDNTAVKFYAYLTFHSYGQYILYPWGYDKTVPPDYKDLDRVGKLAAENIRKATGFKYQVGPAGSLLYPAAGASDDWAKGMLKIKYTYTLEMRDAGRYGFILPANQIEPAGREAMEFVHVVSQAVAEEP